MVKVTVPCLPLLPSASKQPLIYFLENRMKVKTQASRMNFIDTSQKKWPLETPIHWSGGNRTISGFQC